MSEENGWLELPKPAPRTLPAGAKLETEENVWTLETEHRAAPLCYHGTHTDKDCDRFENSVLLIRAVQRVQLPVGYQFLGGQATQVTTVDDLGDTPSHLRELLRAARERVAGSVVGIDDFGTPVVWGPTPAWWGWIVSGVDDARRSLLGWDSPSTGGHERGELRSEIEAGRCYPTADARRIGREEFGMAFGDEERSVAKVGNALETYLLKEIRRRSGSELNEAAEALKTERLTVKNRHGLVQLETDEDLRARLLALAEPPKKVVNISAPGICIRKGESAASIAGKVADSLARAGFTEHPYAVVKHACACGATENVRPLGYDTDALSPESARRSVMRPELMCGPCYQSKRRAELQSAKVEQLKGEMDRKVPKWCEAPKGWPEQFSGSSYED